MYEIEIKSLGILNFEKAATSDSIRIFGSIYPVYHYCKTKIK